MSASPPLPSGSSDATAGIDFRALFDAAPNPYLVLAPDFTILWSNPAYLRATGRSFRDLQGRSLFGAFPSGAHDPDGEGERLLRSSLERVLREGTPDSLPLIRYAIPDEATGAYRERFWSAWHTPVFDARGRVSAILQQTDDVTELQRFQRVTGDAPLASPSGRVASAIYRRAETVRDEMRSRDAERRRLLKLFDEAPAFVALLKGPEHVFELANRAYLRLVGEREVIGKSVREALPDVERQGLVALLDEVYDSGEPFVGHDFSTWIQRQGDGAPQQIFTDFVFQPVTEEDGSVSGVFVLGTDITRQKEAQREVEDYRNRLEERIAERTRELQESEAERRQAETALRHAQKMEAIGQLTGGVAHDFNNILQVVGGNLQLLRRHLTSEHDLHRLDAAVGAVERGAKLAAQLLAFARRQPLAPRPVNLCRLVAQMDELLRRALGEAVEIETAISDDLWNTLVDPDQVENVLLNLAVNARDAMEGCGRLTIEAENVVLDRVYTQHHSEMEPGPYVMLAVSDTGCGMTPEVVERAFEPFFSTKPEGRGTGLGLSMAYGFVKQSGGHLKIYSEPGHGTTVRIYLPRSEQDEERRSPHEAAPPAVGGTETILVVEDDATVRATVVDMLRELGYRVLKACDGPSALELAKAGEPIDLLFTDVVMPGGLRGSDLALAFRDSQPGAAVLYTSGYTENAIVHAGRLDPDVELLSKPYRQEELARKIREVLHRQDDSIVVPAREAQGPAIPLDAVSGSRPLRILLVEDDYLIQAATADILSDLGHQVVSLGDAETALDELKTSRFDVLFCDLELPGMPGTELARQAARCAPELTVVFATGYGEPLAHPAAAEAVTLVKPYTTSQIEQVLAGLSRRIAARTAAAIDSPDGE